MLCRDPTGITPRKTPPKNRGSFHLPLRGVDPACDLPVILSLFLFYSATQNARIRLNRVENARSKNTCMKIPLFCMKFRSGVFRNGNPGAIRARIGKYARISPAGSIAGPMPGGVPGLPEGNPPIPQTYGVGRIAGPGPMAGIAGTALMETFHAWGMSRGMTLRR